MLVLVRHGQSVLNAQGRLAGRLDTPLTDVGRGQAAAAAAAVLALGPPRRVISSPLQRARDTAAALGLPVTVDERWIEIDYGPYDGVPVGEVPGALWKSWRADVTWVPPGGESLAALAARVRPACEDAVADPEGVTVVVSHVSPIKAAVAWALGVGTEVSWRMFVAPASITVIAPGDGDEGAPTLRAFNITAHLDAPAPAPAVPRP